MSETRKPVLGVSGTFASGKDTVAEILRDQYNVCQQPTAGILREKTMEKYGNIERETLHKAANEFRQEFGGDYLVQEGWQRYLKVQDQYAGVVFTDMRSLGEARAIKNHGGELIFVDAPVEVRYERMMSRARDNETRKTLDEFVAGEMKERSSGRDDEWAFNIDKIGKMADIKLDNSGTYEELVEKIHEIARAHGLKQVQ